VDSGCDLPDEFLRKFSIPVLPHSISVGKDTFGDQRNPAQMGHFYSLSLVDRSHQISSGPASSAEIERILRAQAEKGCREFIVQTINGANSPTLQNTRAAAEARHLNLHPILSMHRGGSTVTDTLRGYDTCTEALFALAAEQIRAQALLVPIVVVSIAGQLRDLARTAGFAALEKVAQEHGVKVYPAVMSLPGGINLGPGTVALALASKA